MSDKGNRRRREDKTAIREAKFAEDAVTAAEDATRTTHHMRRKGGVTRRKLKTSEERPKNERGAYRVTLEEISGNGHGHVNALHTKSKPGIERSMSAHVAFEHNKLGKIISVIIPKATTSQRRLKSKKLDDSEIGEWVKENVIDWKKGIWFSRIGYVNIISDRPLKMNGNITGHVLISSKKVEQHTRKGGKMYYFPHIIILGTEKRMKPAFELVIDNMKGENVPGQVHIGPTIGALRDDKEVEEYLHLKPCK